MPVAAPNTREVDDRTNDSASRYMRGAETFIDSTSALRIEEEIDIAFPRLDFELRKTAKPGYLSLGIARVLEIHDRNILFDEKYVPPMLTCAAHPVDRRLDQPRSSAGSTTSSRNCHAMRPIRHPAAGCRASTIWCCSFSTGISRC